MFGIFYSQSLSKISAEGASRPYCLFNAQYVQQAYYSVRQRIYGAVFIGEIKGYRPVFALQPGHIRKVQLGNAQAAHKEYQRFSVRCIFTAAVEILEFYAVHIGFLIAVIPEEALSVTAVGHSLGQCLFTVIGKSAAALYILRPLLGIIHHKLFVTVISCNYIRIIKMLLVSVKIFFAHFQRIKYVDSRSVNMDIIFQRSYEIGIELIIYAALCGALCACKIAVEKFNGLFRFGRIGACGSFFFALHISYFIGHFAVFHPFFKQGAEYSRLYLCSRRICLIHVGAADKAVIYMYVFSLYEKSHKASAQ